MDDNICIKYDKKKLTLDDFKDKLAEILNSFDDDKKSNYSKFNDFCSKLEEGALVWTFPYNAHFGFHCNEKVYNYVIYKTLIPSMKYHSLFGNIYDKAYNLSFYYVPNNQLELITKINNILLQYHKYENLIKTFPSNLVKCIYNESTVNNIDLMVSEYFKENMNKYELIKLN